MSIFLFALCLLGAIIGIIGAVIFAIKKNNLLCKRWLISAISSFALCFIVLSFSDKPAPTQQSQETIQKEQAVQQQKLESQQIAFKLWYTDMGVKLNMYDNIWAGYKKVFESLESGEIDRYVAYSKLKHINDLLNNLQHDFWKLEPPKDLSDEHKELLRDVASTMSTATSCRGDAVQGVMKFLDDPKPSTQQKVLEDIQSSDSFAIQAASQIVKVREELQLPAPEQKQ